MISKEWNRMDTYLFEAMCSYYGASDFFFFLKRWPLKKGERDATHTHIEGHQPITTEPTWPIGSRHFQIKENGEKSEWRE